MATAEYTVCELCDCDIADAEDFGVIPESTQTTRTMAKRPGLACDMCGEVTGGIYWKVEAILDDALKLALATTLAEFDKSHGIGAK